MSLQIKVTLYNYILNFLHEKIAEANASIASIKESRDNESKSSAGDKYETGRAMMQQEMDKNEMQLNVAMKQLQELSHLNIEKTFTKVDSGSMVIANGEKYFIAIGLGKIELNGEYFYVISLASPLGSVFKNKIIGDKFVFKEKEFFIENIL